MSSPAVLLTCALTAGAFAAAPAPLPGPWVRGWDRPVDPVGDCRFTREGDKLTITVPGAGHGLDVPRAGLNAPRLMRSVRGDFVVQVRVCGNFAPTGKDGYHRAGLLLTDGKNFLKHQRAANLAPTEKKHHWYVSLHSLGLGGGGVSHDCNSPPPIPVYLRLERRGEMMSMSCSADGKKWNQPLNMGFRIVGELKLGVIAEAAAAGEFKVEFDEFKLTPLPVQVGPKAP